MPPFPDHNDMDESELFQNLNCSIVDPSTLQLALPSTNTSVQTLPKIVLQFQYKETTYYIIFFRGMTVLVQLVREENSLENLKLLAISSSGNSLKVFRDFSNQLEARYSALRGHDLIRCLYYILVIHFEQKELPSSLSAIEEKPEIASATIERKRSFGGRSKAQSVDKLLEFPYEPKRRLTFEKKLALPWNQPSNSKNLFNENTTFSLNRSCMNDEKASVRLINMREQKFTEDALRRLLRNAVGQIVCRMPEVVVKESLNQNTPSAPCSGNSQSAAGPIPLPSKQAVESVNVPRSIRIKDVLSDENTQLLQDISKCVSIIKKSRSLALIPYKTLNFINPLLSLKEKHGKKDERKPISEILKGKRSAIPLRSERIPSEPPPGSSSEAQRPIEIESIQAIAKKILHESSPRKGANKLKVSIPKLVAKSKKVAKVWKRNTNANSPVLKPTKKAPEDKKDKVTTAIIPILKKSGYIHLLKNPSVAIPQAPVLGVDPIPLPCCDVFAPQKGFSLVPNFVKQTGSFIKCNISKTLLKLQLKNIVSQQSDKNFVPKKPLFNGMGAKLKTSFRRWTVRSKGNKNVEINNQLVPVGPSLVSLLRMKKQNKTSNKRSVISLPFKQKPLALTYTKVLSLPYKKVLALTYTKTLALTYTKPEIKALPYKRTLALTYTKMPALGYSKAKVLALTFVNTLALTFTKPLTLTYTRLPALTYEALPVEPICISISIPQVIPLPSISMLFGNPNSLLATLFKLNPIVRTIEENSPIVINIPTFENEVINDILALPCETTPAIAFDHNFAFTFATSQKLEAESESDEEYDLTFEEDEEEREEDDITITSESTHKSLPSLTDAGCEESVVESSIEEELTGSIQVMSVNVGKVDVQASVKVDDYDKITISVINKKTDEEEVNFGFEAIEEEEAEIIDEDDDEKINWDNAIDELDFE